MVGTLGRKYRQIILEPGRSRDEMHSIVNVLGRGPSSEAFNEHLLGLPRE